MIETVLIAAVETAKPAPMAEILATAEPYPIRPPENDRAVRRVDRDLRRRVDKDQSLRERYVELLGQPDRTRVENEIAALAAEIQAVDAENITVMKDYAQRYGWFPTSTWNWRVSRNAWILVQHADQDPTFQERVLATMAPLAEKGEVTMKTFAYLYDRVAAANGVPQRFATQGTCTAPGVWEPLPLEMPGQIDTLRNSASLEPLDQYAAFEARRCGQAD